MPAAAATSEEDEAEVRKVVAGNAVDDNTCVAEVVKDDSVLSAAADTSDTSEMPLVLEAVVSAAEDRPLAMLPAVIVAAEEITMEEV